MPGIPPTPIELAITPLDTEIIAAIQEPTNPQINGNHILSLPQIKQVL